MGVLLAIVCMVVLWAPAALKIRYCASERVGFVRKLSRKAEAKRVSLQYERKGLPTSCFGDIDCFISGVNVLRNQ